MSSSSRLVRIRYRQLSDILAQAWITEHGSVIVTIRPDLPIKARCLAVRQALREIESNGETTMGPTRIIIPADPIEDVRDDPMDAG